MNLERILEASLCVRVLCVREREAICRGARRRRVVRAVRWCVVAEAEEEEEEEVGRRA